MKENLFEIDLAMNMIKEEVITELYELVSKENKDRFYKEVSSRAPSFSEAKKD